jgi:hypothetical protein
MNNQELERLRKIYPLFKMEVSEKRSIEGNEILEVDMDRGHAFHPWLTKCGRLDHEAERHLDLEHCKKYVANQLKKQYPNLHISLYIGRADILVSVWVDRDDRGAEAIGHVQLFDANFKDTMTYWEQEAILAKQDGFFFCSGHKKAEPKSEYGYFHFAGEYCKKYGEENPKSRKAAARETYI